MPPSHPEPSTSSEPSPSTPSEASARRPSLSDLEADRLNPDSLGAVVSGLPKAATSHPDRSVTIAEAVAEIRTGTYKDRVQAVRRLDDKGARDRAKKSLPGYTFSGRFRTRSIEGLIEHSGVVCLDLDDLSDPEATRREVARSPHVLAAFKSPSGRWKPGLKVLVPVRPTPSNNEEHGRAYVAAASAVGVATADVDPAAKDVSRLCFTSWDPDLYLNPDAVPVGVDYDVAPSRLVRPAEGEVARLEEGRKYETLRHFGGLLRYGGASGGIIRTALQAVRLGHSDDPGEAGPIDDLAEWLGGKDPDEHGSLDRFLRSVHSPEEAPAEPPRAPAFAPFPTSALPEAVASYVRAHAAALNVDEAAVAVPALAALGAAVGNSYQAEPKPGWLERAAFWCCLVQPSGTLKSQAVYVGVAPTLALEQETVAQFEADLEEYEARVSQWSELPKALKRETPKPQKPKGIRYRTGDATVESVGAIHSENPRGLLVYRDELSGWYGSFDRYARGDADMAIWIEMCGGRPIVIDRKGSERGPMHVHHPNVSVVGTIQPATLADRLGPSHFASGFAARLLLTEPPTRPRRWTTANASPEVNSQYHALIRRLYEAGAGSGVLPFSVESQALFAAFYDENGAVMGRLPDGPLRASVSKIEGYAVRLALVFHLCDAVAHDAEPCEVLVEAVERAVVVARWLRSEQARVYHVHGFDRLALDADGRKSLGLPETFTYRDVCDVWNVGKSGAYVVIKRLVAKGLAEDAGHGEYRRLGSRRLDLMEGAIAFDPTVQGARGSTGRTDDVSP